MNILDELNLIPNKTVINHIISNHPFDLDLSQKLNSIKINLSEIDGIAKEMIKFDSTNTYIELGVGRNTHLKENFKYILYHEFGHAADRLNANFKYSENEKSKLNDKEKMGVMEIWNIYIDARLNENDLFYLGYQPITIGTLNGKVTRFPDGIEGKLLSHISMLESCGMEYIAAKELTDSIWNIPSRTLSYMDMISYIKQDNG